jgi:hypothetical protein
MAELCRQHFALDDAKKMIPHSRHKIPVNPE